MAAAPVAPQPPPPPPQPRIFLTPYAGEAQLPAITALIEHELSEPYNVYTYRYFLHAWPQFCFIAWAEAPQEAESAAHSRAAHGDAAGSGATASEDAHSAAADREAADCEAAYSEAAGSDAESDASSQLSADSAETGTASASARPRTTAIGVVVSKLEPHRGQQLRGYIAMLSVAPGWRGRRVATRLVHLTVRALHAAGAAEVMLETEVDNVASLALYESFGFIREKRLFRFYMNGKDCFRLLLPVPPALVRGEDLPAAAHGVPA